MTNHSNVNYLSTQFLNFCKTHKRLSPDSIRAYYYDLKKFNSFLSSLTPPIENYELVTKKVLEAYLNALQNYQVKTIRRKLAGVCSLFSYLEYEELVVENPFLKFKLRMREPQKLKVSLSIDEIGSILNAAYDFNNGYSLIGLRDIAVLELLFAGGMRVSELCQIKFTDIDFNKMCMLIHGKGNKERNVYLENKEVIQALTDYLNARNELVPECPFIFITRLGGMLSTQAVRNLVTKYAKIAGIKKKITPHIFRHSFASLLLEEGVDIKYIQDLLGHSSISTTQLYLHTSENAKRNIVATKHPREQLLLGKKVN